MKTEMPFSPVIKYLYIHTVENKPCEMTFYILTIKDVGHNMTLSLLFCFVFETILDDFEMTLLLPCITIIIVLYRRTSMA